MFETDIITRISTSPKLKIRLLLHSV